MITTTPMPICFSCVITSVSLLFFLVFCTDRSASAFCVARRVLERSLYNVEGFREAFDREAAKGGEFFDIIDRILHKADKACKEWSKYEYEEAKRHREAA